MAVQDANQGKVSVDSFEGQKAVIKGVKHPNVPGLRDLEWWMLSRECRTLQELEEIEQVPGFLGYPDNYSFAMEYRPGQTLRELEPEELPPSFFTSLEETVRRIHELQIVHSDLKRRENILVSPDGEPVIIDWGTTFRYKPGPHPLNNWLYRQFKQIDLNAISKYKKRYCPELMEEQDERRLNNPVFLEKFSRFGRDYILFRE